MPESDRNRLQYTSYSWPQLLYQSQKSFLKGLKKLKVRYVRYHQMRIGHDDLMTPFDSKVWGLAWKFKLPTKTGSVCLRRVGMTKSFPSVRGSVLVLLHVGFNPKFNFKLRPCFKCVKFHFCCESFSLKNKLNYTNCYIYYH